MKLGISNVSPYCRSGVEHPGVETNEKTGTVCIRFCIVFHNGLWGWRRRWLNTDGNPNHRITAPSAASGGGALCDADPF